MERNSLTVWENLIRAGDAEWLELVGTREGRELCKEGLSDV